MDELAKRSTQNEILEKFADSLNISETRFNEAKERYEAIGKWMHRDESTVKDRSPEVYTQGSFRLGTVIKPISDNDHYDIDLVCQLDYSKQETTQKQLKEIVGGELKAYAESNSMKSAPEESKRCWVMNYADADFHMDVLPCVPENDADYIRKLVESSVSEAIAKGSIGITDNTLESYPKITPDWMKSNPKGYSVWFKARMGKAFHKRAHTLVEQKIYASVEEVPSYEVKSNLQKSIQILKRHRDLMFKDDKDDNKPISIIINTLAGHSYQDENSLIDALTVIVENMEKHIEKDGDTFVIKNPVRPEENFADKWVEYPSRRKAFFKWLGKVKEDMKNFINQDSKTDMIKALGLPLGGKVMNEVLSSYSTGASNVNVKKTPTYPEVKSQPGKPWMQRW